MPRDRRGQASMEYMLILCTMVTVACVTGYFLKDYAGTLIDRVTDKILDAIVVLAFG